MKKKRYGKRTARKGLFTPEGIARLHSLIHQNTLAYRKMSQALKAGAKGITMLKEPLSKLDNGSFDSVDMKGTYSDQEGSKAVFSYGLNKEVKETVVIRTSV